MRKDLGKIMEEDFLRAKRDWTEQADELSFDDVSAMVSKAVQSEYGSNGSMYDSRYYVYKIWPDKVCVKRSYSNKNTADPLFLMHPYTVEPDANGEDSIALGDGEAVTLGFIPASSSEDVMVAMREVDELSIDDPALASSLTEETQEEDPDEVTDDDDGEEDEEEDDEGGEEEEDEGGEEEEEASAMTEQALQEQLASLKVEDFKEELDCVLDEESNIVEQKDGSFIIENMAVLGPKSKNGRIYPADTRKRSIKIFEGSKAYCNHPKKGEEDNARTVQELIGVHRNLRFDEHTDMLRSDLHLSPTALVKDYVIPHAKANPGIIGNSIAASGKIASNGTVLEITKRRSVDLVVEPATTNGIYEGVDNTNKDDKNKPKGGEETMTLEEILANEELVEELREHFREEMHVEGSVVELQEENESLKAQVQEFKIKEETMQSIIEVDKILKEAKIPEDSKKDKDLRELLEAADPEARTEIISRLEKVAADAAKGIKTGKLVEDNSQEREKEVTEEVDRKKLVTTFARAFASRR